MKLIRFTAADSPSPHFGVVVRDDAVKFPALERRAGKHSPHLADSRSYLANLPDSERAAAVAGFCIINDVSARDVQATEFVGGFCLTKDMAKGNQLGPYLVTPDEVGDPYNLKVTVVVNGEVKYRGSTSEISHKAEQVFAWLGFIAPLKPGSVMGFGTIPDCTGCDHDDFIDPGAEIQITFERLGTLRCRFGEPTGKLLPSRWPVRESLRKYHW